MRRVAVALLAVVLGAACTGPREQRASPVSPSPTRASPTVQPIVLDVVADLTPKSAEPASNSYVDGMRLAVDVVNRSGGVADRPIQLAFHDPGEDPRESIRPLVRTSTAILYVGPGTDLLPLRLRFERIGT
ncbi:MAG TPA: hypothetical protein VF660_06130, partial [Actinomycetota bacterium]